MVRNVILRCLEPDVLGRSIAELVKKGNISVIMTLVSGELVFGDLTLDSQNEYLEFIPQQDRSPKIREYIKHVKPEGGWAIKEDLELDFNARKGQIHGYAKTMQKARIEGVKCLLYIASTNKHNIRQGEWVPIMIKENSLTYPQEFFPRIASEMTFYGEEKQVPVRVDDNPADKVLMMRAIGYLRD